MPDFMRVDDDGVRQRVYVTLATGFEVECKPVARQMAMVGSSIADPSKPAPPQYEMTGAGGAKEKRDHDPVSIEDAKTDPKEKAAWVKYLERLDKWQEKVTANQAKRDEMEARFIALRAFEVPDRPDDAALLLWAKEQEALYGIAPESGNGLSEQINVYLLWIMQEVFATEDDAKKVMLGVMRASGMDAEAIDQAVDMFWSPVGNDSGSGADDPGDPGTPDE